MQVFINFSRPKHRRTAERLYNDCITHMRHNGRSIDSFHLGLTHFMANLRANGRIGAEQRPFAPSTLLTYAKAIVGEHTRRRDPEKAANNDLMKFLQ